MFKSPVVDLYVTGSCNLACGYCFGEVDTRGGMRRNTFGAALAFARCVEAHAIELCGGEPLLYRDFRWATKESDDAGFDLILRTNAYYLAQHRDFVAEHFKAVGVSIDGDAESNDRMRPVKNANRYSAQEKLELPLHEVELLKALNPGLRLILASVATRQNASGIIELCKILLARQSPFDMWKVYQFVPNNFRAKVNAAHFLLADQGFVDLRTSLESMVGDRFELRCRTMSEVDGSCLAINQRGDVLVGARRFGNVLLDPFAKILEELSVAGAESHITINKALTYGPLERP